MKDKSAAVAALLSFIFPGLGHLFLSRRRQALAFALPPILVAVVIGLALLVGVDGVLANLISPSGSLTALILILLAGGWRVVAMLDAVMIVRRKTGLRAPTALFAGALLAVVVATHGAGAYVTYTVYEASSKIFTAAGPDDQSGATPGASGPEASGTAPAETDDYQVAPEATPETAQSRINILLTGIDSAETRTTALTDTLMVLSINPADKSVVMLSLPRDISNFPLYDGRTFKGKINSFMTWVRNHPKEFEDKPFPALMKEVGFLLAMVAIRMLRVPQVFTAHELLPWSARPHHRRLFALLYRVVDAVVVHNGEQRTALIERFRVRPAKVHVAPLGDYALFATPELPQAVARTRVGIDEQAAVALFFGTIRPSKGLEVLLHAWSTVSKARPDAKLVIVGKPFKGLDPAETVRLIGDLGIADSVTTRFEHVDPTVTNDYYRAADVVVLPYHEIGTSGVLRYAYNSARPVIATAVGEHPSRIDVGRTGYLVAPGDARVLAEALIEALRDRAGLAAMGKAAHAYADANFRWLDSARTLLQVYGELQHPS